MKKKALLLATLLLMAAVAMAQQSISVSYKGQQPVITDFVNAILSQRELNEALDNVRNNWNRRRLGQQMPEGVEFIVDERNGFVRYNIAYGPAERSWTEFCYWNCNDGTHKLVAVNTGHELRFKPVQTECTGLTFYSYDNQTRTLTPASAHDLGASIIVTPVVNYRLPRQGKDITAVINAKDKPVNIVMHWDGMKFHQEQTQTPSQTAGGDLQSPTGMVMNHGVEEEKEYIRVTTAEGFLNAIGSERNILIAADTEINLTPALNDAANFRTTYRLWMPDATAIIKGKSCIVSEEVFDGRQLTLVGFKKLLIRGERNSRITVDPRYAFCLRFIDCEDCTVDNLTIGHTEGGYCEGGVIGIMGGRNTMVCNCDLYGCGTYGLEIEGTDGFNMFASNIHDCTYGIMQLRSSRNLNFIHSDFFNNREFDLIGSLGCEGLSFEDCRFFANWGDSQLFSIDNEFRLSGCAIYHPTQSLGTIDLANQSEISNQFSENPIDNNITGREIGPDGHWVHTK
ncbi:MAG: right-handed parallel beta-helix repeat-containing protein [Prevotella sp.]|nr:right-handed parallel beta-helix repeat-containing protein [Prevotella sp.]